MIFKKIKRFTQLKEWLILNQKDSLKQNRIQLALGVAFLSSILYILALPPFICAEFAYFCFVPFLLWATFRPSRFIYSIASVVSGCFSWFVILIWLRHVTWIGLILLSLTLGLLHAGWLCVAKWIMPDLSRRSFWFQAILTLGLSGFWVLIEWFRSWFLTGFLWMPLAATQWQRPIFLQILILTGAYGLSFFLIFFNQGLAVYIRNIIDRRYGISLCPIFGFTLAALCGFFWCNLRTEKLKGRRENFFKAGIVQPYIAPDLKWDDDKAEDNLRQLETLTYRVNELNPDVIFWPEASTPWPVKSPLNIMKRWVEALSHEVNKPLVIGALAREQELWYNGVFVVNPETGFQDSYYAKQKRVPFGEYAPLRNYIPFVEKILPVSWDVAPGNECTPLVLELPNQTAKMGALVCYEDIFPHIAHDEVAQGADFIFVVTNDAWYGEGGGAYQHAAHSILRAVETRRPIIRCGNGGWSGWINEYGEPMEILTDAKNRIYCKGVSVFNVTRDVTWVNRSTMYVEKGDWLIEYCAWICFIAWLARCYIHIREKAQSY